MSTYGTVKTDALGRRRYVSPPPEDGIPDRAPSSTQLTEIARLSKLVLGHVWPTELASVNIAAEADRVLRALNAAHGVDMPGVDLALVDEIRRMAGDRLDQLPGRSRRWTWQDETPPKPRPERKPPPMTPKARNTKHATWLSRVQELVGPVETHACPTCNGSGEVSKNLGATNAGQVLFGMQATMTPARLAKRLRNPSLDDLERIQELLIDRYESDQTLQDAADWCKRRAGEIEEALA